MWRESTQQRNEAAKVKWEIVPFTRGAVLELGHGAFKTFPHFIRISNSHDSCPDLFAEDLACLSDIKDASCDAVFSSHLLDTIDGWAAALADWWRCIKVGGHLVLYLPHKDYCPRVGTPGATPGRKHDFASWNIIHAMEKLGGWNLVVRENRNQGDEYSFLVVFQKLASEDQIFTYHVPPPKKPVLVIRYGGLGDMIQAINILPELKRQRYHITMATTPAGQDIIRHDPHIDAWYIQDDGQVPNHELGEFWAVLSKKYLKVINLCESVEGSLLAMPGRINHGWPDALRHECMNVNYLERTASIAGLPYVSESRFYATEEETNKAMEILGPPGPKVLWVLSGTSCHKFYPHMDPVIQQLLDSDPDLTVFLVGDYACKILERGWEKEKRVVCLSGEIPPRMSMALAQLCGVVIGCETGVLNAVAFESNRKVVLLSHSSHENLTKHWRNCHALSPVGIGCYPCHRLHMTWEFCHQDTDTGAALCQVAIPPQHVFDAVVSL